VAQRIEDQEYVASKKVKGEENIRASEEEADMQKEAAGENVIPIYNTIRLEETLYHFMPLAGYGNGREIQSHLSALHNPMLATEILKFVIRDILTGLKTMHEKGIYHLDIKPENIVFTKDGTAYITDFGCAKKAERGSAQMSWETIGDNRYFSPERLQASFDSVCGMNEDTTFSVPTLSGNAFDALPQSIRSYIHSFALNKRALSLSLLLNNLSRFLECLFLFCIESKSFFGSICEVFESIAYKVKHGDIRIVHIEALWRVGVNADDNIIPRKRIICHVLFEFRSGVKSF